MTSSLSRCFSLFSLLSLGAVALAPGCDNPRDIAPLRDGLAACDELVDYCEAPAAALGEPYRSCFQAGEDQKGNACLHVYYDCIADCKTAGDNLGGAGGEAGASAGAGQGGNGGAR